MGNEEGKVRKWGLVGKYICTPCIREDRWIEVDCEILDFTLYMYMYVCKCSADEQEELEEFES